MKKTTLTIILVSIITVIAIGSIITTIFILNSGSSVSPSNSKAAVQANASIALAFDQTAIPVQNAGTFTVTMKATPNVTFPVQGYKFRLDFNSTSLHLTNIVYNLGNVSADLGDRADDPNTPNINESTLNAVNTRGYIIVYGESQGSGIALTSGNSTNVVTLTFSVLSATNSEVSLNSTDAKYTASFAQVGTEGELAKVPATLVETLKISPAGVTSTTTPVTTTLVTTSTTPVTTTNSTTVPVTTTVRTTTTAPFTTTVSTQTTTPVATTTATSQTTTVVVTTSGTSTITPAETTTVVPTTTKVLPNTGIAEDITLTLIGAIFMVIGGVLAIKIKSTRKLQ